MRKTFHPFSFIIILTALFCGVVFNAPVAKSQAAAKASYVCPMRCGNAVYEKTGACTVCGMQLVEKASESQIAAASTASQTSGYVCPPCGNTCDNTVHEKAGACPVCGMALVKKGSAQALSATNTNYRPATQQVLARSKKVAIFIFEGVQIIDYAGPYEVFGQAGFEVFTVAEKSEAITTAMGMSVNPQYKFADHPLPNILLLPGGNVPQHQNNPNVIKWIQENAKSAEVVLSVCNGAFFLAKAGLLDGLEATTFASLIDGLQAAAPKARVVSNKRFVDNGKIITSAGLSSGMDGALHVVEKVLGKGWAQRVATNLEYDWDPESKYVRAALADKHLENVYSFMQSFEREILRHEGDAARWETQWRVQTESSAAEVLAQLNSDLAAAENKWQRTDAAKSNGANQSRWKFTDNDNKNWNGVASVESIPGEKNKLAVTVKIARSDVDLKR